ncbi:threonine/serine exporter family protein [Hathewaya limosa]|uniref:Uncharacterized membrane protein YjjB (DUF3815 family) n=1 Tax=Hathewaya limosa TaxID=1536 RepID=A0ABU0JU78_HATLI|nr:threonine/serine exporter family protein [Hathewaya limosa]AWZ49062.1 hypothetical protein C3495_09670 [Clostridiaceae bacterium 14S0207]MDQ0479693.1 uncharacterized membrane protein YjjB (DUF3815 family) [Hathewaya limosa]
MKQLLFEIFYSFLGSLGFAVLFNIRGKNLVASSIGGALGWFIYKFFLIYNLTSSNTSIFLATLGISIYSEIMARVLKQPVTVFVIAAMIPLVPGSGMYYTTFATVQGDIFKAVHLGLKTLYDAGSIAIGIILVSTIARILKQKKILRYAITNKINSTKKTAK